MQEVEVTWGRAIKVWWSLMWKWSLVYAVSGFVWLVMTHFGHGKITQLLMSMFAMFMSVWIVKIVLGEAYSDFRLVLLAHGGKGQPYLHLSPSLDERADHPEGDGDSS